MPSASEDVSHISTPPYHIDSGSPINEAEIQRQGRIELLENMKKRAIGWLTEASDRYADDLGFCYLPFSDLHINQRLQLELAVEQLDALLQHEYTKLNLPPGEPYIFYSTPPAVKLPRYHIISRRLPPQMRHGYGQRSPLRSIPEE